MARFTHPSAAESLREEHACLMELFPRVREVLAARSARPQKVLDILEHLAQHVLDHFEREEKGGYFTEALQAAPQLHKQIKTLLSEHTEMALQLIALHQHAATGSAKSEWWRTLEVGFEAFYERFTAHENAENWVALVAYGDDIGTGD